MTPANSEDVVDIPDGLDSERSSLDVPTDEPRSDKLVFISYRVHPDQVVAAAVKRLIESTLAPCPQVFVSGLGGLKASAVGFKPQLQKAVQEAQIFVGIITPASKDREWIFYEAGAAWGRGAIYVPLLVDLAAHDLPSSIADYQAYRTQDRGDMESLFSTLAGHLGAVKRSRFGTRFAAFQRQLASQKTIAEETESSDPLAAAMRSMLDGASDAETQFDDLEREVTDQEELVRIKALRILSKRKEGGPAFLDELSKMDEGLKSTVEYAFWRHQFEPQPGVAIRGLRAVLARPTTDSRRARIYRELAERLVTAGHDAEAVDLCVSGIRTPSRVIRVQCCSILCGMERLISPLAHVLLAATAAKLDRTESALQCGIAASVRHEFLCLRLFFASAYFLKAADGEAANELGRAYEAAGLKSLAYDNYTHAAEKGVAVGWVNAASLLEDGSVAAAGLKLLVRHDGEWDSSAPDYPYRVRASLEKSVAEEMSRAEKLRKRGERAFEMLVELAEIAIAGSEGRFGERYQIEVPGREAVSVQCDGQFVLPLPVLVAPLHSLTQVELQDEVVVVFARTEQGPVGLAFALDVRDFEPCWVKVLDISNQLSNPKELEEGERRAN